MAFKRHPVFIPAPSETDRLWRYMSLAKYLSLILKSELFLSNLELMARSDPFEGTLPPAKYAHRKWNTWQDAPPKIQERLRRSTAPNLDLAFENYKELRELRIRQSFSHRRSYFINCWHLNEFESAAMWDLYSKKDEGIAIVSSEERLISALKYTPKDVLGGQVSYADYGTEDFEMDDNNAFTQVLHKRMSFQHEKEYRLVYWDTEVTHKVLTPANGFYNWDGQIILNVTNSQCATFGRSENEIEQLTPKPGHTLKCDLNALIDKIYISPFAESWFVETVTLASSKAGITAPVILSELLAEPKQ